MALQKDLFRVIRVQFTEFGDARVRRNRNCTGLEKRLLCNIRSFSPLFSGLEFLSSCLDFGIDGTLYRSSQKFLRPCYGLESLFSPSIRHIVELKPFHPGFFLWGDLSYFPCFGNYVREEMRFCLVQAVPKFFFSISSLLNTLLLSRL